MIYGSLFFIAGCLLCSLGNAEWQIPCEEDANCTVEECCVRDVKTQLKYCREMGHRIWALCGGEFRCSRCLYGLECEEFSSEILGSSVYETCRLPANGSCQNKNNNYVPVTRTTTDRPIRRNATAIVQRSCESDMDCTFKECCVPKLQGGGKICREIGDTFGESCGGEYFCSACRRGLTCILSRDDDFVDNIFFINNTETSSCDPPANGTCQYIFPAVPVTLSPLEDPTEPLPYCSIGFKIPCLSNGDCRSSQCCVPHYTGKYKVCQDKKRELGSLCGGQYFCNSCGRGLQCVPSSPEIGQDSNQMPCPFPANGTCQLPPEVAEELPLASLD